MKANFLPQQLVNHILRVFISQTHFMQIIAHSHIILIAMLAVFVWAKPEIHPVEHISYNPVLEATEVKPISKTKYEKVSHVSFIGKQESEPKYAQSNIGNGFALIKACESGGNYSAINPAGYYGAYQFSSGTWNSTAQSAGRNDLVGVRPDQASPSDQDAMAKQLHSLRGWQPWGCAYHVGLL